MTYELTGLRRRFAEAALSAFTEISMNNDIVPTFYYSPHHIAQRCWDVADAMMAEAKRREKK